MSEEVNEAPQPSALERLRAAAAAKKALKKRMTLLGVEIEIRQPDIGSYQSVFNTVKDDTNPDETEKAEALAKDTQYQMYRMIQLCVYAVGESEPLFPNIDEIKALPMGTEVMELINSVTEIMSMDNLVKEQTKN